MTQSRAAEPERRERPRFKVNAPISLQLNGANIEGFTRNMSNKGVFFYVPLTEDLVPEQVLPILIELPPEITQSSHCRIRCSGRIVRIEKTATGLTGVAAEILDYSLAQENKSAA